MVYVAVIGVDVRIKRPATAGRWVVRLRCGGCAFGVGIAGWWGAPRGAAGSLFAGAGPHRASPYPKTTKGAPAGRAGRALRGCVEGAGAMATAADCTALRPLALAPAAVYEPCALHVKKTELMEGGSDTHGIRSRRKEGTVDWLVRVLCRLECCDRPLVAYCGVVALPEKHG